MKMGPFAEDPSTATTSLGRGRSESRWVGRRLVAGCVSAILVFSVALAYATPPDPSWIPGIYDDRDGDDVVGMVTEGTGVNDVGALPCVECALVGFGLRAATEWIPSSTLHRQTSRGPPPIESVDAPVDALLTLPAKTPPPSNVPPIQPDHSSKAAWVCPARASPPSLQPSACGPWFAMLGTPGSTLEALAKRLRGHPPRAPPAFSSAAGALPHERSTPAMARGESHGYLPTARRD
jgi:hypothetical protein